MASQSDRKCIDPKKIMVFLSIQYVVGCFFTWITLFGVEMYFCLSISISFNDFFGAVEMLSSMWDGLTLYITNQPTEISSFRKDYFRPICKNNGVKIAPPFSKCHALCTQSTCCFDSIYPQQTKEQCTLYLNTPSQVVVGNLYYVTHSPFTYIIVWMGFDNCSISSLKHN